MTVALKSWKALGTSVHVLATDASGLGRATTAVSEVLEDVDTAYSRFRQDSELSRLNASPGRVVRVSPLLATAIDAAQRAARLTDGAVDPTIGQAIRVAGYDDDFSRVAARDPHPALPQRGRETEVRLRAWRVPGWKAIGFDRRSRVVLLPDGVELDLGSTGKALAADLAARAALNAAGAGGVLVSLGGDIATAGTPP
ncbi:MAG TPA: FAD:protein FMN transferase, partial [Candidatus Binatus sp.]|nr:FAD:protein FMN transferase [Candidatus Binatus sp.]